MIFIFLSGVTAGAFSLGYKMAGRHNYPTLPLLTIYSLAVTIITGVMGLVTGSIKVNAVSVVLGTILGLSSIVAIFLYFYVTRHARHNISWTVIQFSVIMPFVAGIAVYGERPTAGSLIGAACIFAAILLFGVSRSRQKKVAAGLPASDGDLPDIQPPLKVGLILATSAILSGVSQTVAPEYLRRVPEGGLLSLMFASGAAMTVLCLVLLVSKYHRTELTGVRDRQEVRGITTVAVYMAALNVAAFGFLLLGLRLIPSTTGFPARNAVNILTVFILSFLLYKEHASRTELVGVAVAIAGITLVSAA